MNTASILIQRHEAAYDGPDHSVGFGKLPVVSRAQVKVMNERMRARGIRVESWLRRKPDNITLCKCVGCGANIKSDSRPGTLCRDCVTKRIRHHQQA